VDDQGSSKIPVPVGEYAGRYLRRGLRTSGRAVDSSDVFDVTVVIPTRNEAGNVVELLRRLDDALGALRAEVLFVDDSDDETPSVIRDAAVQSRRPVRLLHREPGRREGRLGGAVVVGFQLARAPWAVVIDGDLQHPPEIVPALLREGLAPDVDLVYGTRYDASGDAGGLNGRVRELVSRLSTVLAKAVFPHRLRRVSDPMSGLFAIRLRALDLPNLKPAGYKVLLEVLAQSRLRRTAGVPYSFQERFSGQSKASLAEGVRFGVQLVALRLGVSVARLTQLAAFLVVGVSGVVVNTVALWVLSAAWLQLPYLLASVLATNVAIVWNFVMLEMWVFRKRRHGSFAAGFARFWMLNAALLPIQLGLLAVLVEGARLDPVVANVVTLVIVFVLRYVLTSTWVYSWNFAPADVLVAPRRRPAHAAPSGRAVPGPDPTIGATAERAHRRWPKGEAARPLRVVLPVAATLVAFPAAAVLSWQLLSTGGLAGAGFVAVCLAGVVIVALRAAPAAGEPDVHDRQLDVILAAPLLAAAVWLSFGWPTRLGPGMPWGVREVVAVTAFLVGASLLLLGTRLTARIRWALCQPLLSLPAVTGRPLLSGVLIATVVLVTAAVAVLGWLRNRAAPTESRQVNAHNGSHPLPRWRLAAAVVFALAMALGVVGIESGPVSHPVPVTAEQSR
jgi:putative flippase GtrA